MRLDLEERCYAMKQRQLASRGEILGQKLPWYRQKVYRILVAQHWTEYAASGAAILRRRRGQTLWSASARRRSLLARLWKEASRHIQPSMSVKEAKGYVKYLLSMLTEEERAHRTVTVPVPDSMDRLQDYA